jgi:class 3 adenylate cyclase
MDTVQRSLCVLVATISGDAVLHEKLGDAETRHAVDRCLNRIERVSVAHLGRQRKAGRGEIFVVFDTIEDAFLAAGEIQQKIEDLPPVSGCKLAVRIGFCAGEVIEQPESISGHAALKAKQIAALAEPGQVITDDETVRHLPPTRLASLMQLDRGSVGEANEAMPLWQVLWRGDEQRMLVPSHFAPTQIMEFKLRLRHGETELFVSGQRNVVTLGRAKESDIVIHDPRASRNHARIELRHDKFVLIDLSKNGTYIKSITSKAGSSVAVKSGEAILSGQGRLSFGRRWKEGIPDYLEYIVIE